MTTGNKALIEAVVAILALIAVVVLVILPPDRFTVMGCLLGGYQLGRFAYKP